MNTLRHWLLAARLALAAFGRVVVAIVLLSASAFGLYMFSLRIDAWDRLFIAKAIDRIGAPTMANDIVLVHVAKKPAAERGVANHHESRLAVASLFSYVAELDANQAPSAVVLDMAFRRRDLDKAPASTSATTKPEARADAEPEPERHDGFDRIEQALQSISTRFGAHRLSAVLDPFHQDQSVLYFLSSEPWFRDLKFADVNVRYGHTAFEVDSDCTVAAFWPAVNVTTHPIPPGESPENQGPFADVAALALQVAHMRERRDPHERLLFSSGSRRGAIHNKFAFDFEQSRQLRRFDAERKSGIGGETSLNLAGKIVIVGDMESDKYVGTNCSIPGIELLGWLVTDLRARRPTIDLLNPRDAAARWLVAPPCAIVGLWIVRRRTTHSATAFFHPLRTMLFGTLGGTALLVVLCVLVVALGAAYPGFLVPAGVVLATTVVSAWYFHRIRTAVTDIFISYKHAVTVPRWIERQIYWSLRTIPLPGRRYANVFLDRKGVELSQIWKDKARHAIDECKIFIPILSREYIEQVHRNLVTHLPDQYPAHVDKLEPCAYELFCAMHRLDSGLRLCPVLLEDVQVPTDHPMLSKLSLHLGKRVENGEFDYGAFRRSIRKIVEELPNSRW